MTDFTPWLRPTLLGPFVTTWAFVTLGHLGSGSSFLEHVLPFGERLDGWLVGMLVMSFFAAMIVVGLLTADLALLRAGLRKLPTGGRAWLSALVAPVAVWISWAVFGVGDGESIPELVLMISWPMLGAPLALRFALGAPTA